MSIDTANAHAVTVFTNAIAHATKLGHTDLVAALTALGLAAEAGIEAGKGSDLGAQGDALSAIFHALQPVVDAGLTISAVNKKDPIHSDVVNVYNSIRNVGNSIDQSNMARLHAALAA